jgi:hypothetical protein
MKWNIPGRALSGPAAPPHCTGAKTFQLSQLPLTARALSQMPAPRAGPSTCKRKWYKMSSFQRVDLGEMSWLAVQYRQATCSAPKSDIDVENLRLLLPFHAAGYEGIFGPKWAESRLNPKTETPHPKP